MSATWFNLVLIFYGGDSAVVLPTPYRWEECIAAGKEAKRQYAEQAFGNVRYVCVPR